MTETLQEQTTAAVSLEPRYTVQTGDTLAKIANVYYGNEAKWSTIHVANVDKIGNNPHELQVGLVLDIPT